MPFADMSAAAVPGGLSDALVHDVITRLAKLRNLRVIAQGTVFALRDQRIGPEEAGRLLAVDYIVSGSVQWRGSRVVARIELAETVSSRIVWAEVLDHAADDTFLLLDEIGNQIVSSVDREIETMERNRAVLKPPNSLDAWEAHHRGLWHMYRFTKGRQRSGPALLRDRDANRSHFRPGACRPLLHALAGRVPGLERPQPIDRPRLRRPLARA
jgi:TolB-like protein